MNMEDDIRFDNIVLTVSLFVILYLLFQIEQLQNKNHSMAKTLSPIKEKRRSEKKSLFSKQIKSLKHKIDKLNLFIKNFKKFIFLLMQKTGYQSNYEHQKSMKEMLRKLSEFKIKIEIQIKKICSSFAMNKNSNIFMIMTGKSLLEMVKSLRELNFSS